MIKSICASVFLVIAVAPIASAQTYYRQRVVHPTQNYTVVTPSAPVAPAAQPCSKPTDPCNTPSNKPCNCECKVCLDCEIKLPDNCCKKECTPKPLYVEVLGKIPTVHENTNCYVHVVPFEYEVKVPTIVCWTRTCTEISKRSFECIPGCSFELCVPINECEEKVVKCELRNRKMRLEAKKRDNGLWDVYVLNDVDPASAYHAGGMPKIWLTLHCATLDKVKATYPNVTIASVETKDANSKVAADDTKSLDTDIQLVIKEEELTEENAQAKELPAKSAQAKPASKGTATKLVAAAKS